MRARRWWLAILVLLAAMAWQSQRALESGKPPTVTPSTASDGPEVAAPALDSTALPPTAASAEPADGAATAKPLAVSQSPAAPTLPTPTPAQAREWMRQRQRDMECATARRDIASEIRETREWPWMPPERVAAERAAIAEARERLLQGCPPEIADEAERKRHWAQRQAELEAARRAGDLLARLSPGGIKTPEERNRARATLYDALLSGDPEVIAQIGRLQDYIQPAQIFDAPSPPRRPARAGAGGPPPCRPSDTGVGSISGPTVQAPPPPPARALTRGRPRGPARLACRALSATVQTPGRRAMPTRRHRPAMSGRWSPATSAWIAGPAVVRWTWPA